MSAALNNLFGMKPEGDTYEVSPSYHTDTPMESVLKEVSPEDDVNTEEEDFKYTRKNQYDLIEVGKAAVQTALKIASESEQPRAIETLALMLKTASEMNRQLTMMSKDKSEAKKAKNEVNVGQAVPQIGNQTNNMVVMSGSLEEVLAKIKKDRNEPI
jgi:hypothetical protein